VVWFGFVWVVLQLLLGWERELSALKLCWDGGDGMGVHVGNVSRVASKEVLSASPT